MAEDLEYHSLLSTAVAESDPVKRLAYVAAFVVSGYACTKLRASRKPLSVSSLVNPRFYSTGIFV